MPDTLTLYLRAFGWLMVLHDDADDQVWDVQADAVALLHGRLSTEEAQQALRHTSGEEPITPEMDAAIRWAEQHPDWLPIYAAREVAA